jgi:hypothetical protein
MQPRIARMKEDVKSVLRRFGLKTTGALVDARRRLVNALFLARRANARSSSGVAGKRDGMKYNQNGTCDLRCRAARALMGGKNKNGKPDMRLKKIK